MGRFGLIWAGFLVSFIGTSMARFAIGVQVFLESGSVTRFALVALSATVPLLLLSALAGVVADRFDRRVVLLTSVFGASMPHLGLWHLAATGRLEPWHIYPLIAASASMGAFIGPTLSAMVPQLVGKQHFARASGLLQTGTSMAAVIGPLLGGMLLPMIGLANIILINVTSFFAVVVCLLVVRIPQPTRALPASPSRLTDATTVPPPRAAAVPANPGAMAEAASPALVDRRPGAGWRFIKQHPGLLRLLLLMTAMNFFVGTVQVLLVPLVLGITTPRVLGMVLALASAGALVGGATIAVWGGPKRRVPAILTATALQGAMLMLGCPFKSATVIAIAAFFYLLLFPISTSSSQAIWQAKTPPAVRGRVFAFRAMIAGASIPIAQSLAGPLADHIFEPAMAQGGPLAATLGHLLGTGEGRGIALMLGLAGFSLVLISLVAARTPSVRRLEIEIADAVPDAADAENPTGPGMRLSAGAALAGTLRRLPRAAGQLALLVPLAAGGLALLAEQPPSARTADAPLSAFSAHRAQRHVEVIAQRPHPTGSPALEEVRDYLRTTLEALGLETMVQQQDVRLDGGRIASLVTVENVLARLPGSAGSPAILLMAHYDSVPTSSGAADNASGVAALLETARALCEDTEHPGGRLRHDVIFLFTDAEEVGLHGARAFVRHHPWAGDVAVAINLEARGHHGPVYMFQTGRQSGWWTRHLFRAVSAPRTSSLTHEIFRRLPNATDFNVLRKAGIPGFDLAMIRGLTHYHTDLDRPEALSLDSLQHHGSYALGLARHLGTLDLDSARPEPNPTYFNIGSWVVHYPTWLSRLFAAMVAIAALALLLLGIRRQRLSPFGLMQGFLAVLVQLVLVPVTISLVWMSIRDSANLSMLMGSTPGAERLMLAFALLAAGLSILVYQFFRRSAGPVDLLAGSVIWWLLALAATTDLLVAASGNFIALWPLAGALTALGWLVLRPIDRLSGWATAVVLALAAVPAFLVITPLVAGLYPALQASLQVSGIALVPLVLVFTLLAPNLEAAGRSRGWWPAGVLAVGAFALLAAALADRGPRLELSSAVYAIDADQDEQHWFSFDPQPAQWTHPLGFAADHRAPFTRFFPLLSRPLMIRPAATVPIELPSAKLLPNAHRDRSTVRLEIGATRQSRGRLIAFEPPDAVLSVDIDGTAVNMLGPLGPSRVLTRLPVRPRETLTLRLRRDEPFIMTVVEQLEGFPDTSPLGPRGPLELARPMLSVIRTDVTLIRRSFRIDPSTASLAPVGAPAGASSDPRGAAQSEVGGAPSSSPSTAATVSSSASATN